MSASLETLSGRFVNLRPLTIDDAAITLGWRLGARARLLNGGATDVTQQAQWITARPSSERNYIIELKSGQPVGMLSLVGINLANRNAEPSRFVIGDETAVRGVPAAVEAMSLLYRMAFDDIGLVRLYGTVASGNVKMLKWQKYLGMQEEGRMRQHLWLDGAWHDAVMLGLLESDYRSITLPRMRLLLEMAI